jgi:hypothetical protein
MAMDEATPASVRQASEASGAELSDVILRIADK